MILERKGLTSGTIKGLTVCCVCFYSCTLLWMAVHSTTIQSSVLTVKYRDTALCKTHPA
ncbi:unnamed protein product, partial [Staurois parvus]